LFYTEALADIEKVINEAKELDDAEKNDDVEAKPIVREE
jgi:hypothetical protein